MAKPNSDQEILLMRSKARVINKMKTISEWSELNHLELLSIELGILRKSSVRRHGATRWKGNLVFEKGKFSNPDVVDIHPKLLNPEWRDYLDFVMYHEFIHCMGFKNHDSDFRRLEGLWDFDVNRASSFSSKLRLDNSKYHWVCSECDNKYPRSRKSNGRYLCRDCKIPLIDRKNFD